MFSALSASLRSAGFGVARVLQMTALLAGLGSRLVAADTAPVTEIRYLSGRGADDAVEWDFFISEGRRSGEWTKIRVPSCWEQEGFGSYQFGMPLYGKPNPPALVKEQGKYRYEFEIPAAWRERRVRIVFEGSMTDTHVRVNGISMGPAHQGAFYRFKFEMTDVLKYGAKNQIEITVDKESANESVNLAERRADYWNFGGIFRPVYLEALPPFFVDRSAIVAEADGTFAADVVFGGAAPVDTVVTAQILDDAGTPVGAPFSAAPAPGSDRVSLRTRLDGIRRWTAETPALYRVTYTVTQAGKPVHTATERFGFRTFEVRAGKGLYLNGERVLLRGVNRHSFRPETGRTLTKEQNYADARLIKEMNMNAVRLAHYPADPEFLDACDELGLYVLNELGGWHGRYDTAVGKKLVAEMVTRDVNHPSILFWCNGNEGGWNTELDDQFAVWDPRKRPVLHPQKQLSGVETMHYRSYGEIQEYLRGKEIYMPTEFLHALYDGGAGAGLWDYWEMMRQHPRSGGGFIWALSDEGLVRTDQNGRIDNAGNYAPDGIVGPHHEREGSFYTIKEIWSPVQILAPASGDLPADFSGVLSLENRYDFTSLAGCRLEWSLEQLPAFATSDTADRRRLTGGELALPDTPPDGRAEVRLPLPADWRQASALYVTVKSPTGERLWTWSWGVPRATETWTAAGPAPTLREEDGLTVVTAGALTLRFSRTTGRLVSVVRDGKPLSLGEGPRFIAARRADRTLDGNVDAELPKADPAQVRANGRIYAEIKSADELTRFAARVTGSEALVEADYFGALRSVRWRISGDGRVRLEYEYGYDGVVELMGVQFDYPESLVESIRWVGRGPYRSWQNRLHGTTLGLWNNTYNDTIPGESFVYPEFKGYFHDWRWAALGTKEGTLTLGNGTPGSYLGVYTPRDGRDGFLFTLPSTGLAVFDVIPAMRNKVNATDLLGPSSEAKRVSGLRRGAVEFRFETK